MLDLRNARKEKPPPFRVEVFGIKPEALACGGLRSLIATAPISNVIKTKASPGGEAFLDKAPGGDLLRVAIFDRNSNAKQRKTPTVSGEGCSG